MEIPKDFIFDPNSGLYYKEKTIFNPKTGEPIRRITWLNKSNGETREVDYPVTPPENKKEEVIVIGEASKESEDKISEVETIPFEEEIVPQEEKENSETEKNEKTEETNEVVKTAKKKNNSVALIAVAVALIGVLVGGVFLFQSGLFEDAINTITGLVNSETETSLETLDTEESSDETTETTTESEVLEILPISLDDIKITMDLANNGLANTITVENFPIRESYDAIYDERGTSFNFEISLGNYSLSLYAISEDEESETLNFDNIISSIHHIGDGAEDIISNTVYYEIEDNKIVFNNVVFPNFVGFNVLEGGAVETSLYANGEEYTKIVPIKNEGEYILGEQAVAIVNVDVRSHNRLNSVEISLPDSYLDFNLSEFVVQDDYVYDISIGLGDYELSLIYFYDEEIGKDISFEDFVGELWRTTNGYTFLGGVEFEIIEDKIVFTHIQFDESNTFDFTTLAKDDVYVRVVDDLIDEYNDVFTTFDDKEYSDPKHALDLNQAFVHIEPLSDYEAYFISLEGMFIPGNYPEWEEGFEVGDVIYEYKIDFDYFDLVLEYVTTGDEEDRVTIEEFTPYIGYTNQNGEYIKNYNEEFFHYLLADYVEFLDIVIPSDIGVTLYDLDETNATLSVSIAGEYAEQEIEVIDYVYPNENDPLDVEISLVQDWIDLISGNNEYVKELITADIFDTTSSIYYEQYPIVDFSNEDAQIRIQFDYPEGESLEDYEDLFAESDTLEGNIFPDNFGVSYIKVQAEDLLDEIFTGIPSEYYTEEQFQNVSTLLDIFGYKEPLILEGVSSELVEQREKYVYSYIDGDYTISFVSYDNEIINHALIHLTENENTSMYYE